MVFSNHKKTGLLLSVKKIRADLENIRKLRNRIFHHEPIIGSSIAAKEIHQLIYFYLESMAPEVVGEVKKIDRVEMLMK